MTHGHTMDGDQVHPDSGASQPDGRRSHPLGV